MRKRPAQLVNPHNAHTAVTMQLLGIPTGKERTTAENRARLAEPGSDRPKVITGNVDDGTWIPDLMTVLEGRGIAINKTERGGRYGDQLHNAKLVNSDSPEFRAKTQAGSDTASTTNVSPLGTVIALSDAIVLPSGKWAIIVVGSVHLSHSTGGSSDVSTEINGIEGTIRTIPAVGTAGMRCAAHSEIIAEGSWIQGDQTVNVRVRFRSNSSGTTSAKNPEILTIVKRME